MLTLKNTEAHDQIEVGIFDNIPLEEYHASDAISMSKLKTFIRSPLAYYETYVEKTLERPTINEDSRKTGNLIDCLITEPERFEDLFAVLPASAPTNKRTNAYKDYMSSFAAMHPGKEIISAEDLERARAIVRPGEMSPLVQQILRVCDQRQTTIRIRENGLVHQCRIDLGTFDASETIHLKMPHEGSFQTSTVEKGKVFLGDVKTTLSLHADDRMNFYKHVADLGYYLQCAYYTWIVKKVLKLKYTPFFVFLAYQTQRPYQSAVTLLNDEYFNCAQKMLMGIIGRLEERYLSGVWSEYPDDEAVEIAPPYWLISKFDEGGVM